MNASLGVPDINKPSNVQNHGYSIEPLLLQLQQLKDCIETTMMNRSLTF